MVLCKVQRRVLLLVVVVMNYSFIAPVLEFVHREIHPKSDGCLAMAQTHFRIARFGWFALHVFRSPNNCRGARGRFIPIGNLQSDGVKQWPVDELLGSAVDTSSKDSDFNPCITISLPELLDTPGPRTWLWFVIVLQFFRVCLPVFFGDTNRYRRIIKMWAICDRYSLCLFRQVRTLLAAFHVDGKFCELVMHSITFCRCYREQWRLHGTKG